MYESAFRAVVLVLSILQILQIPVFVPVMLDMLPDSVCVCVA
jgi:hypothetical protein